MKKNLFAGAGLAALLAVGCNGEAGSPLEPTAVSHVPGASAGGAGSSATHGGAPLDVSGTWVWSSIEKLTMPPFVAQFIFGIPPEGPVTRLQCETSGTMTLDADGTTFDGSTTQAATCRTGGGLVFVSPPSATPPLLQVVDGSINGRSLTFTLADGGFTSCEFHGVITGVDDEGVATNLRATGRCIVPGHPRSPAPLDPPPAGTSKTIVWTASRS